MAVTQTRKFITKDYLKTTLTSDAFKEYILKGVTIVSKTSQLENDSNFLTTSSKVGDLSDGGDYAKTEDVPTTVAQLTDSSDYAKETEITAITDKIPSAASSTNQLADKKYVDDSISTATATFRGSFSTKADLDAYTGDKDANDYAVVLVDETDGGTKESGGSTTWRYKWNGTAWAAEYKVNDTALTADQIAATNSGITADKVSIYDGYSDGKQDSLSTDQLAACNSGITATGLKDITDRLDAIETYINNMHEETALTFTTESSSDDTSSGGDDTGVTS